MTTQPSSAPGARRDPRRTITSAKVATLVGSAVGFGAVVGLVLIDPIGGTSATAADAASGGTQAAAPAQQQAPTPATDFFSPPPGFTDQPPIVGQGSAGQSSGTQGFSGSQGGFNGTQGFSGSQGGFGQVPGMRSGGS
jgi:hypothetical protein